jgi:tetratricopeptide (TPR) repeat protein
VEPSLPPPPGQDAAEVALFSSAMRAWRSGDGAAALTELDRYLASYPGGHFAQEAQVVRVDALQALGRSGEALAFLRTLPLAQLPRAAELRVIRGELAARAGQCQEALADFDAVLARDRNDALGPRALYARASCRARLGDELGAETDLRVYLIRYPGGPHVAAVRRVLAGRPAR